jgi:hypothetical protein
LSFQLRLAKKQIDDIPGPEVEFEKNGIFWKLHIYYYYHVKNRQILSLYVSEMTVIRNIQIWWVLGQKLKVATWTSGVNIISQQHKADLKV